MNFIHSFQSEWLKRKRSLSSWLVLVGAFFTPTIILLARIKNKHALPKINLAEDFWQKLWFTSWESMSILLLPLGITLAVGLITQLEYKNNTWKQLHATPQDYTTIFLSKFAVILILLIEVFILFNVGFFLSAILPSLIFNDIPFPSAPIPYEFLLQSNLKFFVGCLPVLALQYLLSLQFKNFLVPIGTGFVLWILSIGMLSWQYSFIFPYIYSGFNFMIESGNLKREIPVNIQILSITYFVAFMIIGYVLYLIKKEKA